MKMGELHKKKMITRPDFKQERKLWQYQNKLIVACDEAGRGSLAGPVVAAAFLIKNVKKKIPKPPIELRDSKQLSFHQREILFDWIKKQKNFYFATAKSSHRLIDKINIRQANFLAMKKAIKTLVKKSNLKKFIIFVDGREEIPDIKQKQFTFIKGDAKVFSLACASIVAKVTRDRWVIEESKKYPNYDFEIHKGYGTKLHFRKIKKYGLSEIHRKSFLRRLNKEKSGPKNSENK